MKLERQSHIIEIIKKQEVENQEELLEILIEQGVHVAQATISRDIKELGIIKTTSESGKQKYTIPTLPQESFDKTYIEVLKQGFVSMDFAQNIIVVKTISGMGMAVAAAFDELNINEIIGCIGGDDTVFLAIRNMSYNKKVMEHIKSILKK